MNDLLFCNVILGITTLVFSFLFLLTFYFLVHYKDHYQKLKTRLDEELSINIGLKSKAEDLKIGFEAQLLELKKKISPSDDLRSFINDITSGSGTVDISYINPQDMYFHRR